MGLIETIAGPLASRVSQSSPTYVVLFALGLFITVAIVVNVLAQIIFKNKNEPPIVFHWVPFIGSTVTYGIDPYKFFFSCRQKYGDVFTFILLGKKTTVFLGTKGNDFILNGKLQDLNAEEIYQPLTMPVFGRDVVYDCPNAKLMEQKKFVKFGLTTEAFKSYVTLIVDETKHFLHHYKQFEGKNSGILDVPPAMSELTIYTASSCLQGKEVRSKFDSGFADAFHDLDAGFQPINFMMPWAPLPQNRKRDAANRKMANTYLEIIRERREKDTEKDSEDMIWNLMQSVYKSGVTIPDQEIAHMMIALLMAGQHSSATTASFILLRLASKPHIIEELLAEQKSILGTSDGGLEDLTYENLQKLALHAQCVKETLRIHAPIHSIMRKVKSPMHVEGTGYTIPPTHTLLAAPGVTSRLSEYFPEPAVWNPHRWDAKPTTTNGANPSSNLPAGNKTSTSSTTNPPSTTAQLSGDKKDAKEEEEEKIDYGYGLVSKGTNSPYLPFGAGRHRCIGEQFAYLQLTTILATFVREVKLRNEGDSEEVPGTDYSSLFSRPLRPAKVQWERREPLKEKA